MELYIHYLACFFAGAFLANAVPHFVHGISGDRFPTPFAKPPGRGLSSPTVNVLWGLLNLIAGFFIYSKHINTELPITYILAFTGAAVTSIMLSIRFQTKHKE